MCLKKRPIWKRKRIITAFLIVALIVVFGVLAFHPAGEVLSACPWSPRDWMGISGRAEDFAPLPDAPLYSFSIYVGPTQYRVEGFDDNIIGDEINLGTKPLVRVIGKAGDNDTVDAYIIYVYVNAAGGEGAWDYWYYYGSPPLTEEDYLKGTGERVWLHGYLTENGLLGWARTKVGEHLSVPSSAHGKEAYIRSVYRSLPYGAKGLEIQEVYVRRRDVYVKIYP